MNRNTPPSTAGYASEAPDLLQRYEAWDAEYVHADVLGWFPDKPSDILDIGAGTGRDAAYFAARGHRVLAVEPVAEMREGAIKLHPQPEIDWLDDHLPKLEKVVARGQQFDMVSMSAVWMHLDEAERTAGIAVVASLMRPGARLFMSLRHGIVPRGRRMFDVSGAETATLAARHGLNCLLNKRRPSIQPASETRASAWTILVFEMT